MERYKAGDTFKRGNHKVVVEKDETDEEFEARRADSVVKGPGEVHYAVINGERVAVQPPEQEKAPKEAE